MSKIYELIASYGPADHKEQRPEHDLLARMVYQNTIGQYEQYSIYFLLKCYDAHVEGKQLSWRPSASEPQKYRTGKPGKMIRQMFPHLDDVAVEAIQVALKNEFMFDPSLWEIHEGMNFGEVYLEDNWADTTYTETTRDCKLAEDSCMRYEFNTYEHPADAFASGDFRIVYITNEEGLYLARTVYRVSNKTRGPIYCTSQRAYDHLQDYCTQQGITQALRGDWVGAKLCWQGDPHDHETSGPYIDVDPQYGRYDPEEDPDHFYIVTSSDYNMDLTDHEGILSASLTTCSHCSALHIPTHRQPYGYCSSCAEDLDFETCAYTGGLHPQDEMTPISNDRFIRTRYLHMTETCPETGELHLIGELQNA